MDGSNFNNGQQAPQGFNPNNQAPVGDGNQPGKGAATASLVLGIISVVCWFFGVGAAVGLVTGIIGLILASSSKKAGFEGGIRTAGFVLSLIGIIGSAIVFVACIACVGIMGSAGALGI